ncbi:S-adenosyl-L-methionine-dependent methyltransferases superfamily protein [Euphorbia peplus]|nr:S-adenosyl-L-methionine-dependent methyltransferases superfamily protein [Euphorbia peplus]
MAEFYPINGGDGTYSYSNNSSLQKQSIKNAKSMIDETIRQKLDVKASNTFRIADLGCSVGPNAFLCVQNIIQEVKLKYHDHEIPEFQVFFNDHTFNDFNTLFRSLPQDQKPYFAAGVPGSFHERLFPENSLHFVHSSNALHWLSHVPMELLDTNSPAWNKGRIFYHNAPEQVIKGYALQFAKDVEIFLNVRAKEIVEGGIMVLLVPARIIPDGVTHPSLLVLFDALGSCLMDMANAGLVSERIVDSFNLPLYFPSANEMLELVERNGRFKIEKIELFDATSNFAINDMQTMRKEWVMHIRAGIEGLVTKHFGNEIIDELFDRFSSKIEQFQVRSIRESQFVFLALKRKISHPYIDA